MLWLGENIMGINGVTSNLYRHAYSNACFKALLGVIRINVYGSFAMVKPKFGDAVTVIYKTKNKEKTIAQTVYKNGNFDIIVSDADGVLKTINKRIKGATSVISTWDIFKFEGQNITKLYTEPGVYLKRVFKKRKTSEINNVIRDLVEPSGIISLYKQGIKKAAVKVKVQKPFNKIKIESQTVAEHDPLGLNNEFIKKAAKLAVA